MRALVDQRCFFSSLKTSRTFCQCADEAAEVRLEAMAHWHVGHWCQIALLACGQSGVVRRTEFAGPLDSR